MNSKVGPNRKNLYVRNKFSKVIISINIQLRIFLKRMGCIYGIVLHFVVNKKKAVKLQISPEIIHPNNNEDLV